MKYSFWLVADSQLTHGPEVQEIAVTRADVMVTELSRVQFCPSSCKVSAKTSQKIPCMTVVRPDNDMVARAMVRAI